MSFSVSGYTDNRIENFQCLYAIFGNGVKTMKQKALFEICNFLKVINFIMNLV